MKYKEYIEYITEQVSDLTESEIEEANFYIRAVKEIEDINEILENSEIKKDYYKKLMLPTDYKKILDDLLSYRVALFYNYSGRRKKELKKCKITEKEREILQKKYENKLLNQLKLKCYTNKYGEKKFYRTI